jgi:hypothetical protein
MRGSEMMPPDKENPLFDLYQEQETESERFWDRIGNSLGYTNERCQKCRRFRVEEYQNGELICEKCGWNKTLEQFEDDRY